MSTSPDSAVQVAVLDDRQLIREGLESLLGAQPGIRVVRSSELHSPDSVVVLIGSSPGEAGAAVRLADVLDVEDLVIRLRTLAASRHVADPEETTVGLTVRERMVLRAVSEGRSATQIGIELGISPRTVERHKRSVLAKLSAPNQASAVARSIELGFLPGVG